MKLKNVFRKILKEAETEAVPQDNSVLNGQEGLMISNVLAAIADGDYADKPGEGSDPIIAVPGVEQFKQKAKMLSPKFYELLLVNVPEQDQDTQREARSIKQNAFIKLSDIDPGDKRTIIQILELIEGALDRDQETGDKELDYLVRSNAIPHLIGKLRH